MTVVRVEQKVLNENQRIALELRRRFEEHQHPVPELCQLARLGQDHAARKHAGGVSLPARRSRF